MKLRRGNEVLVIEVRGRALHVGDLAKTYVDAAKATEWLVKTVEAKRAEGWVEEVPPPVVPRGPEPRNPDLEAAIVRDPDDPAGYAVYGDWLAGQGEPRGTLIALMQAGDRLRVRKQLHAHRDRLYGPLERHVSSVRETDEPPYQWRHGFIHKITGGVVRVADALAHPSGRLVVELDAFAVTQASIDALAAAAPIALRDVQVVGERPLALGPLLAGLPQLRRLRAWGTSLSVADSPILERIELWCETLGDLAAQVVAARWPRLQRFSLSALSGTAADLLPLFARTDWPQLTHLRIGWCAYLGELIGAISTSPFAAQLVVLDFAGGNVGDAEVDQLLAVRARFPKLRELRLGGCAISREYLPRAATLASYVGLDAQRQYHREPPAMIYPQPPHAPARYQPVGE